jgi:anti-sigma regulatory factor (Ser/Thr protein kinase)
VGETAGLSKTGTETGYCHHALFYGGHDEFIAMTLDFVEDAVRLAEPILIALSGAKNSELRSKIEGAPDEVHFADIDPISRNPAHIIPAWQRFLSQYPPEIRLRGVGEPIVLGQDAAVRTECLRHEALLNLAFFGRDFWLLCLYGTAALSGDVADEARRSHPVVWEHGCSSQTDEFLGLEALAAPCLDPLPAPPDSAANLEFDTDDLRDVREFVARYGTIAGLGREKIEDLVLAANEIATNSIRHGGERGTVRAWTDAGWFVCEFEDDGTIENPLVGRVQPALTDDGGRGLWIANQICDLVQIRATGTTGVVRLRLWTR